jgi:hypothetical protein
MMTSMMMIQVMITCHQNTSWTSSLLFPLFSILVARYHYLYHHHGRHRCCSLFLVFWRHVIITCIITMDNDDSHGDDTSNDNVSSKY